MKWTGLNELRSQFLEFFESKDHVVFPSAPLVPREDNSLLLINSGMAPLKKYFTGMETPPKKRATSCQKCIRTPDIERVGKTARHGTYFEMLGNFSFGDYFKHEATQWAWEFITKVLEIPVESIWVSIYQDDDEAFTIWTEEVGVSPDRIVRLGKADNFWEIGSGPCGPCSEIYFDRGPAHGCDNPDCAVGCDCDRYVEFWNLVFTQFDSDGSGNYTPLEHPNIDTGMGLERLACIMQGVGNLFEVDTVASIMKHICEIGDVTYQADPKTDVSLRVMTDHIRSTTMMICDGVVPSNEGRGYVLRRLLRRAARHGRLIGIREAFLYKVCNTVIAENKVAYPQLEDNRDYITKIIQVEEERFAHTIDSGMELLNNLIDKMEEQRQGKRMLSGDLVFKLYDTFGFPVDLTREILEEKNISLDEESFIRLMAEQRARARAARAEMGDLGWEGDVLAGMEITPTFVGYDLTDCKSRIAAIVVDGKVVESAVAGQRAAVVLDRTPFYAEGGGQAGDAGIISDGKAVFEVYDCKKSPTGQFLHIGEMKDGQLFQSVDVTAAVAKPRRRATMRNHTAAHLLQFALREVLGNHVHQAGQLVDDEICRFDFTHFSALTVEEVTQVEAIVNDLILSSLPVEVFNMTQAQAREKGAMALFSEKYGDVVRVVDMGGKSVELCGGTHLPNTAHVGLFKILKESSVAAGVRRIEAVTGRGVLHHIDTLQGELVQVAEAFKAGSITELPAKAVALVAELKSKEKELVALNQRLAANEVKGLFEGAKVVGGVKIITATFNDAKADVLRSLGDKVKDFPEPVVAIFTSVAEGKASILTVATKSANELGVHAGNLVKKITALTGGSGGGRPDSAMGGTNEVFKVDEALAKVGDMLEEMFKAKHKK